MSTPIKRLEIIKNAIELEDDDIIQSQLTRLKNEAFDDELQAIVVALEEKNYTAAMAAITAWLQGQRAVTPWRDPQVAASKLELKALEERLRDLIDRRNAGGSASARGRLPSLPALYGAGGRGAGDAHPALARSPGRLRPGR